MVQSKEEMKSVAEKIMSFNHQTEIEQIIRDNKKEFKVGDNKYRVHYHTLEDNVELDEAQSREYARLIQDPNFLFRLDWVALYKKKNIDLEELDDVYNTINSELKELYIKITEEVEEVGKERYMDTIIEKLQKQEEIINKKKDLLKFSIEDRFNWFTKLYGVYLTLDKEVNGKYVRAYSSFEEFKKSDNNPEQQEVMLKAVSYYKVLNHPKEL